jgi:predicted nucleic acid-binding protein
VSWKGSARRLTFERPRRPFANSFENGGRGRSLACSGAEGESSDPSRRTTGLILTIDTFAWLEVIRGSRIGSRARDTMESAERCLTPSVVLAEVASKCVRNALPDPFIMQELLAIRESSEVVPIDDFIAIAGAHAVEELRQTAQQRKLGRPGLADGLVLATARRSGARLLTGDPHFRFLRETVWLS